MSIRTLFKILVNALLVIKLITGHQARNTLFTIIIAQYQTLLLTSITNKVTSITNILAVIIQVFNSNFISLFHFVA